MTLVQLVTEFNNIQQANYTSLLDVHIVELDYEWVTRTHYKHRSLCMIPYAEAMIVAAEHDLKEILCDI